MGLNKYAKGENIDLSTLDSKGKSGGIILSISSVDDKDTGTLMLSTGNSKGLRQGRAGNLAGFLGFSDSGNGSNIYFETGATSKQVLQKMKGTLEQLILLDVIHL